MKHTHTHKESIPPKPVTEAWPKAEGAGAAPNAAVDETFH